MPARAFGGTATRRSPKNTTAARIATCWPEIAGTCVLVPIQTERGFRFSARLGSSSPSVRFEQATD
jgi:hypothetical protein